MELECYFIVDGERHGPVLASELEQMVRDGRLAGDTLVWSDDCGEDWQPYDSWARPAAAAASSVPPLPASGGAAVSPAPESRVTKSSADDGGRGGRRIIRALANYSWISLLCSVASKKILTATLSGSPAQLQRAIVISVTIWVCSGIVSGLVALIGMAWHGRKNILLPALTGLLIWSLSIGLPVFFGIGLPPRKIAASSGGAPRTGLEPLKTDPTARRITSQRPRFSLDIPKDFTDAPATAKPANTMFAFLRTTEGPDAVVAILVEVLPGVLAQGQTLDQSPPGTFPKGSSIRNFNWRGHSVEAIRTTATTDGVELTCYAVQVPLRPAIQLDFTSASKNESHLLELIEKTLASLDGETNWN